MTRIITRRHQRWHELILLSWLFSFLIGWLVSVPLPAWVLWGSEALVDPNTGQWYAMVVASLAYALSHRSLYTLFRYPGTRSAVHIPPQVLLTFGLFTLVALFLRADLSRLLMLVSGAMTLLCCYADFVLRKRFQQPKLAVTPFGHAMDLFAVSGLDARLLTQPKLDDRRYDCVVADFDAIPDQHWERFLAQCALSRIPVYHARQVLESLTGRVRINHISENQMGALLPSPTYERLKYLFDVVLITLSLPLVLPLVAITALAIRLESPGPVIFRQERVGLGNRTFRIFKFRSMVAAAERGGAQFAGAQDARVTRIGRVIRKLRIDELPQFLNVVRGEMSLIGPRPEQRVFVDRFDTEIPFYSYRHVVTPGITGCAQVMQGYAADTDDTRLKIEHDFYYIKHCSLALDLLIVLRTIQTILTGFGAR
jgi:lipopolysaccharide/colanic/teichoic acid biosynthesis glycosyltransferase